jgi:hypothetical protein
MSKILHRDVIPDRDIILGKRCSVKRNSRYQGTIQRWALKYGEARGSRAKKEIISRIYASLVDSGLRFLIQQEFGHGDDQTGYTQVTEKYRVMQRIQRSLQEHCRQHVFVDTLQSCSVLDVSSHGEISGCTGSIGTGKNAPGEQVRRTPQVTENEGTHDTQIPLPSIPLRQAHLLFLLLIRR